MTKYKTLTEEQKAMRREIRKAKQAIREYAMLMNGQEQIARRRMDNRRKMIAEFAEMVKRDLMQDDARRA